MAEDKFIIFIPGLFGSKLLKGNDVIWPLPISKRISIILKQNTKPLHNLFKKRSKKDVGLTSILQNCVKELSDRNLTVGPVVDSYYDEIIDLAKEVSDSNFFIFTYDWRQSFVKTVKELKEKIETLTINNKDVYIWAHSAGGLIAYDYLNNPDNISSNNFDKIKKCIMMGSPICGSIRAAITVLGLNDNTVLEGKDLKDMIEQGDFQSFYDLIPDNFFNLFSSNKTKKNISQQEIINIILKTCDNKKFLDGLCYRERISKLIPNKDIDFVCIIGNHSGKKLGTNFIVKDGNVLDVELGYPTGDGTVLASESIIKINNNNNVKVKYVRCKHLYLTEHYETHEILCDELYHQTGDNKLPKIIANVINNDDVKEKEEYEDNKWIKFQLYYVVDDNKYLLKIVSADKINFISDNTSVNIDYMIKKKGNGVYSFKTDKKEGLLEFKNVKFEIRKETDNTTNLNVNTTMIEDDIIDFSKDYKEEREVQFSLKFDIFKNTFKNIIVDLEKKNDFFLF